MKIFIVATPIGNLNDITYRAVKTLENVDIILAEDTRVTLKLLNKYSIRKKIISFNEHNEKYVLSNFDKIFKDTESAALVSDAGTPLISDPGKELVKFAYLNNIQIIPIPGVSSLTAMLSLVPFDTTNFIFIGFLEKKIDRREKQLKKFLKINLPFVFFESPKRIIDTLSLLCNIDDSVEIAVGRELTKKFEEILYGKIIHVKNKLQQSCVKGEFVVVVSKIDKNDESLTKELVADMDILKELNLSTKDIATFVSKKYNFKKNYIYNLLKRENSNETF